MNKLDHAIRQFKELGACDGDTLVAALEEIRDNHKDLVEATRQAIATIHERINELEDRRADNEQLEPIFKAGEIVNDIGSNRTVEIMQDVSRFRFFAQCRDTTTNQPLRVHVDYLVRSSQPEPLQVGDWVRCDTGVTFQIEDIYEDVLAGRSEIGRVSASTKYCTKIDPPRFTFGVRVSSTYFPNRKCFYIGEANTKDRVHIAVEGETYRTVPIATLSLDITND